MSRSYQIAIGVTKHNPDKYQDIVEAVIKLEYEGDADRYAVGKPFESIQFNSEVISVGAGQTEDEVAEEIHKAIWKANQGFCEVNVSLLYLEDAPVYTGGRDAYDLLHPEQEVVLHKGIYYGPFPDLAAASEWLKPIPDHNIDEDDWDIVRLSAVPRGVTIVDPSAYRRRKDPNLGT